MRKLLFVFTVSVGIQSCDFFQGPNPIDGLPEFSANPEVFSVQRGPLNEASGMIDASMAGNIWLVNDGANGAHLHMLGQNGEYKGKVEVANAINRDWEDLAAGPGPETGQRYLYIADAGDNNEVYPEYQIYRVKEPHTIGKSVAAERISFKYNDRASLDVEAVFIDPETKDIYLISKRQLYSVRLYKLAFPYSTQELNTAQFLGVLPFSSITAGDISPAGDEIMIKDYGAIFYWKRKKGESIFDALSRKRDMVVPYNREYQGESLCFDMKNLGYYTFSELGDMPENVNLNYYKRIKN